MFHKKYVDFAELIWEDFSYQIDNRQLKKNRREIMPYPRFTKASSTISSLLTNIIGEDIQEYGKAIPDMMLTNEIMQSEAYMAFIDYSTGLVQPKKTKGKGLQGKKSGVTLKPTSAEISYDSDLESAKRQTSSRRTSKKKVSISADDNIIQEPDVSLELGKSISLTEAEEEEAARRVHATHERLVTESDEPSGMNRLTRRRTTGVVIQDIPNFPKKISVDQSQKLKGIQTLTPEEQIAADMMQALKARKKISRSQPHTGGSSEGTSVSPGVSDESTVILTTSSEGTSTKLEVPDEVSTNDEEEKNDDDDDRSIDIAEIDDDKETYDEFVHGDEYVHGNVGEEMKDTEVIETGKDDEEINDAKVTYAKKTKEVNGDKKKAKLPLTSSSLSISSCFDPLPAIVQRVFVLKKDVQELKQVDYSAVLAESIISQVPPDVKKYLGSSVGDALQKVLWKHTEELIQQSSQKDVSEIRKTKQESASQGENAKSICYTI
ncbi:hypothetical protein Tco_0890806 [Tanacetum coccineum]|uniref:Uncharacterized protein n=1 Tax=Tanacetum coccineum TaxID=301880 RepID=A0ABQ5C304_9ASTR